MSHLLLVVGIGAVIRKGHESKSKRARLEEVHARITKASEHPA
jgi:hypothetical protein